MGVKPRGPVPGHRHSADRASGYEEVASEFLAGRSASIGARTVRAWARQLPLEATVLDLGCGSGIPITRALFDQGLAVYAVDASATLVATFKRRFPDTPVVCETVQESAFFDRRFDAVIAWGLLFLLRATDQIALIRRISHILEDGGRFLFTSPAQRVTWNDAMTGRLSRSLGATEYRRQLAAANLIVASEYQDEGHNHYFDAIKLRQQLGSLPSSLR